VIDFPVAVIDGAVPSTVRRKIVDRVNERLGDFDRQGLSPVVTVEGSIGPNARALGGACLPLLASFARDREVMFQEAAASE
jgi:hypothetical protein